jgi:presenilin-like A22 family membrane protease
MMHFQDADSVLFSYSKEMIKVSVFSNHAILGYILFTLVGLFSFVVILCILYKTKHYAYLIIAEGVFVLFFTLTHIIANGFSLIHIFVLPLCIGVVITGVMQTPREF